jgi:hypothetical protein
MKLTISQISDLVDAIEPVGFVAQRDHAEWRNNQRFHARIYAQDRLPVGIFMSEHEDELAANDARKLEKPSRGGTE